MSIDRIVFAFAGFVILLSTVLAVAVNVHWLWVTVFVGANLFQAAFTKFCPLALMLKKAGVRSGEAF